MTQAALPDFDVELEQVKRARANIDLLRKQRMGQPKGEMIGNTYVAPHWSEHLAPLVQQVAGLYAEKQQGEKEAQLGKAMQAGREQWIASRPQATAHEVQGPPEEGMGPPMSKPIEPTQQERLAWATQGERNPLTKALAQQYGADILIKEPEREEARAWKTEQAGLDRQKAYDLKDQQLVFQREQLAQQLEINRGNKEIEERIRNAQMANQLQMNENNNARARENAELAASVKQATAASKAAGGGKPVPNTIAKPIRQAEEARDGLISVHDTWDDKYAGAGGYVDKLSGTWNPFSSKEADKSAAWWSNYENQAALVQRHEKFGTALSKGERDLWTAATIAPGMKAERIKTNLATRRELAEKFYKKIRQQSIDLGYPQVGKAFADPDEKDDEGLPPGVTVTPRKK